MINRTPVLALVLVAGASSGRVAIGPPGDLHGQEAGVSSASLVRTSGRGEVTLEPDRALLSFGIQRRGFPAESVLAQVAGIQATVLDTLTALGVPADSLQVDQLQAWPRWAGEDRESEFSYQVAASISLRTRQIERVPELIEAALTAGVTQTTGVRWESGRAEEARAEALGLALAAARRDAEALAEAAGARLGDLVEVSTSGGPAVSRFALADVTGIEVPAPPASVGPTPQPVVVRLTVTGLWRLETP